MKFRQIAGRPVQDEHSPYHEPPRDAVFRFQRVLLAAIVAVLLALAAVLLWPRFAHGEGLSLEKPYLTLGVGRGFLKHPETNKWWIQEGWDYTYDEAATVARIGLGIKVHKFAALEINYHDLGEYHHFAGFMIQEDLYNETTHDCNGHCEPTMWGYLEGKARAFSLSIVPQYPVTKNLSVFGRLGVARYDAKFTYRLTTTNDGFNRSWLADSSLSQKGWTPVYGLGISYKRLSLEATEFHAVGANRGACCSAYQSAATYTVSYRWDL